MMEILKKLFNKYTPFSLGTLVAFVMMASVISCDACKTKTDKTGTLEVDATGDDLKGKEGEKRKTVLIVKNADADKEAVIENVRMRVTIKREGGKGGDAKVTFSYKDESGAVKNVTIADNESEEDRTKALGDLFNLEGKTVLTSADELRTDVILEPGKGVTNQEVTFQLIDKDGEEIGNARKVIWTADDEAPKYVLETEGLKADNTIDPTINKFTVNVKKSDKTAIAAGEVGKFKVVVKTTGDAKIVDLGTDNKLSFVAGDLKDGVLGKEIKVTPGANNTEFELKLEHNETLVAGAVKTVISKAVAAGAYKLIVDKDKIEDGSTEVEVTVESTTTDLVATELEKLSLKIERTEGGEATIKGAVNGVVEFKGNKLTIDKNDKKKASIKLTIVPGADRKAKFELTLLEGNNPVPGTVKIVEWTNIAKLEPLNFTYDSVNKKIVGRLKNSGKIKLEVNQAQLVWDTNSDKVTIEGSKQGSKKITNEIISLNEIPFELTSVVIDPTILQENVKLILQWDKLEKDEEITVSVTDNPQIAAIITLKGQVEAYVTEVNTELAANKLAEARTAANEAKAKAVAAQTAVDVITDASAKAAAQKIATEAKDVVDIAEALVVAVERVATLKGQVETHVKEVNTELAANELAKARTAADEAKAKATTAKTNAGIIVDVTAKAAAEVIANAAETAANSAEALVVAVEGVATLKGQVETHVKEVNIELAANELAKARTAANEAKAKAVAAQTAVDVITDASAKAAAEVIANAAETAANSAEALVAAVEGVATLKGQVEAHVKEVNTELAANELAKARTAADEAKAKAAKANTNAGTIVDVTAKAAAEVIATEAETAANIAEALVAAVEGVATLKGQVKTHVKEVNTELAANKLAEARAAAEAAKIKAATSNTNAGAIVDVTAKKAAEVIATAAVVAANNAIKNYNNAEADHAKHLEFLN
jgi:hypothetical protein